MVSEVNAMKVQMKLIEDVIFGNGQSIPGEEDISVLCDDHGFPYYKGSTFKGIFREELQRLLDWKKITKDDREKLVTRLLGKSDSISGSASLVFSDYVISDSVKERVLSELSDADEIRKAFTSLRTFTKIDEDGMVQDGSLRIARCVNKGITLHGEIACDPADEGLVGEVLGMMKWVGTMRNRGFGKVLVEGE